MFNNVDNTKIDDVSEEDLNIAMGGDPAPKEKGKKTEVKKDSKQQTPQGSEDKTIISSDKDDISDMSDDELDEALDNDKKVTKKKAAPAAGKDDEDDDQGNDTDDEDGEDLDLDKLDKNEDDEDGDDPERIKDFLKARAELLIKSGKWEDWEDRDKTEWSEEKWEEVELAQAEFKEKELAEDMLDSFGPYGRQIAEYTKNGGNPDELITLFQEQKKLATLSIDTEESQKAVVYKYLTEVMKKTPESANRTIKNLIVDKELEAEAKENKELMEKSVKEESEAMIEEQKNFKINQVRQAKATQIKFSTEVNNYLSSDKTIPDDEKKQLINVLTKFNKKLQNGAEVNDFYFKFAEFKKNLPNYLKMVRLVLNPEKFLKSETTGASNKKVETGFKLARTAQQSQKAKIKNIEGGQPKEKVTTKFKLM